MRRPCRRPRPEAPPPFGGRAPPIRDKAPRRPRPPGNTPVLSPTLVCQQSDIDEDGGPVVVKTQAGADEDLGDVALQGGSGDRLTRPGTVLHPADPLIHSGRWVPAKYNLCKEVPWTGYWICCGNKTAFTTHCPDFEARLRQREADHQRDSAEQLNRARLSVAAKLRAEWESKQNPASSFSADGASCSSEQQHDAESQHPATGINTGLSHQAKRHRPFLRPRWLQFLRQSAADATTSAAARHQAPVPSTPSVSTEKFVAGPKVPTKSAASIRVRKDHVRSVIHLASSEARINAFVVISCLEGLFSVAMEGMTPAHKGIYSNVLDAQANDTINNANGYSNTSCTTTSKPDLRAAYRGEGGAQRGTNSSVPRADYSTANEVFRCESVSDTAATIAAGSSCSSSNGREESGAALCVRLGALPAVLGCLNEHSGHKKIEPLAIRLLLIFASDRAASSAVRGNTAVAAACTSRMFPVAVVPAAGDASGFGLGSDASEPSSIALKDTCCGDERQASAGSGRRRGYANDGQALESFVPSEEESREHPASTLSATTTSKPTTTSTETQPFRMALSSPNASERPAASAEGISYFSLQPTQSNEASTPVTPSTKKRQFHLPATDLVFVLSAAVQGSPECQRLVTQGGGIAAMLAILRQQTLGVDCEASICGGSARVNNESDGGARLAEMCLKVMEGLGQPERGRRRLVREGSVEAALAMIGRFRSDDGVLAAATGLLLLLSNSPNGRGRILEASGFIVVFEAVQRLVGNAVVQVKGVEMLQTLISEEPKARRELDGIKGGWQWLCQGTSSGNALVRYSPGEKHIPGWTVSEEEKLTNHEALATAEMAASDWTPYNLATFMGTMRTGSHEHKLQIGNLAYYHFFRVVSEAGVLPHAHEDVEDWRDRMRRYEDERHIRVSNITRRRLARDRSGGHARSLGSSSASLTR